MKLAGVSYNPGAFKLSILLKSENPSSPRLMATTSVIIAPLEKDQNQWSTAIGRGKASIPPKIEKSSSFCARSSGRKHRGHSRSLTSRPSKEASLTGSGKVVKSPDAEFHPNPTITTKSRSSPSSCSTSDSGTRPAQPKRAAIISNAVFDDFFDVEPVGPSSQDDLESNDFQVNETSSSGRRVVSTKQHTVSDTPISSPGSQRPISDRYDYVIRAESIETVRVGTNQTTLFDAMLRFSFQDVQGKWQPCCGNGITIGYQTTDASLVEVSQFSGSLFGIPMKDVKGKRPVYHGFIESLENISSMVADCTAGVVPHGPSTSAHRHPDTSSTALKCTCTPTDAKLALELYLESTKKQHKQLGCSLRRVGGLTNFLSISTEDADLVQKLSELYSRVKELAQLVMAEAVVSSVTLTEIHRLMDKALTPISKVEESEESYEAEDEEGLGAEDESFIGEGRSGRSLGTFGWDQDYEGKVGVVN